MKNDEEQKEAVEAALTAAKDLLKEVGVEAVFIMVGTDLGSTIRTHIAVSGPAYLLAKLVFEGGSRLAGDLRREAPEVVRRVELECLDSLMDDLEEWVSLDELMEAKTNGTIN